MTVKRHARTLLRGIKRWLDEGDQLPAVPDSPTVPFDNTYLWIHSAFAKIIRDPVCAKRPQYIWGVLQGAALGKVLGLPRVSMAEFGVAGGAGLVAMERAAELAEEMISIGIDVYGFDAGVGMPKPTDYRDRPYWWLPGAYPCDQNELTKRLRRARLKLGFVKDTVQSFLQMSPAPVAFIAFDLGYYSSTKDALTLFDAKQERLLPRIPCFFRTSIGRTANDYTGERLAISEFCAEHRQRKMSPMHGLRWYVPFREMTALWPDMFFSLHAFDHPLYNEPQQLRMSTIIDVEGAEAFHTTEQWTDSRL